jgi:hypothetical protein
MNKNHNLDLLGTYEMDSVKKYFQKSCYKVDRTLKSVYEKTHQNPGVISDILLNELFENKFKEVITDISKKLSYRSGESRHSNINYYGYEDSMFYFPVFFVHPAMPEITKKKYANPAVAAFTENLAPRTEEGFYQPNNFVLGAMYNNTRKYLAKETKTELLSTYAYWILNNSGEELRKWYKTLSMYRDEDGGRHYYTHDDTLDKWHAAVKKKKIPSKRYDKLLLSTILGELSPINKDKVNAISRCARRIDNIEEELSNPEIWKECKYVEYGDEDSGMKPPQDILEERKAALKLLEQSITKLYYISLP